MPDETTTATHVAPTALPPGHVDRDPSIADAFVNDSDFEDGVTITGDEAPDESEDDSEEESTPDAEETTPEADDEPDLDLDDLEAEMEADTGDDGNPIKPLEFVKNLSDEEKDAYTKQVKGFSKIYQERKNLSELVGSDSFADIEKTTGMGKQFVLMAQSAINGKTAAEKQDGVNNLLDMLEEQFGSSLVDLVPDRFGLEIDETDKARIEAEKKLAEYEAKEAKDTKTRQWVEKHGETQVNAFKKLSGFTPNIDKIAPLVSGGMKMLDAVRKVQTKEWEKHILEQGKRAGLKAAKVASMPDTPRNTVGDNIEYYPKGHPFEGMKKRT